MIYSDGKKADDYDDEDDGGGDGKGELHGGGEGGNEQLETNMEIIRRGGNEDEKERMGWE